MTVIRINRMERLPSGFVVNVYWTAYKYENDVQAKYDSKSTFEKTSDDFVPFSDLKEDMVVQWILNTVDMTPVEENLNQQIQSKLESDEPYPDLPWSTIRTE